MLAVCMLAVSGTICCAFDEKLSQRFTEDDAGVPEVPEPDFSRPPGTLGLTYRRKSHAIPSDKHPRTAMLAVRNSIGASILSAQNMGGFRMKNDVWLFETSRPLDFGANHIVRVESRSVLQEVEPSAVRFVRLIPGRLVYLDF